MIANRVSSALTLSIFACLAACSTPREESADVDQNEATGKARSSVIKGSPSDSSQDAVVLLVHYDPATRGFGQCTGVLLAPRLVLTARHCIGSTDAYTACKSDGTPLVGGVIRKNHKANTMYVFTGKNRPDFGRGEVTPAGQGTKILDDGAENLCNHDIALIVLKEPVEGAQIAPIRLDADVEVGELVTAIGWGVTEKTRQPRQRMQRTDIEVASVGPHKAENISVPPNEFEVGESICSGDSGGPAIAQTTNAVLGVVSRGGNMDSGESTNPAAGCIGGRNLYTKVAPFKDLILQGYALAEAEPWLEGGPDPRKLLPKEACTSGDECRSGLCLPDPGAADDPAASMTCAEDCSATKTCAVEGEICTAEGESMVCRVPKKEPAPASAGTCSSTPSRPTSGSIGGALMFALFALASFRRARPT